MGIQICTIILLEIPTVMLLRMGWGSFVVVLPHHRKALVVYSLILISQWVIFFVISYFGTHIDQSAGHFASFLDSNNWAIRLAGSYSLTTRIAFDTGLIVFLSNQNTGSSSIPLAVRASLTIALIVLTLCVWSVHISWIPLVILRSVLAAWSFGLIAYTIIAKRARRAVIVVGVWMCLNSAFALAIRFAGTMSQAPCWLLTMNLILVLLQPLVLYFTFHLDTRYWKRLVERRGFSSVANSVARPLMEQFFPSRLLMDYNAFTFEEMIGEGTQAQVFRAKYRGKSTIAVKRYNAMNLTDSVIDNFLSEAVILFEIEPHKHILPFIGVSICPPYLCICFELCKTSLYSLLETNREQGIQLGPEDTLLIALDVALGMQHLHKQQPKIVHRDLKSHNVLMVDSKEDGRMIAKVADMGCSQLFDDCDLTAEPPISKIRNYSVRLEHEDVRRWFQLRSSVAVTSKVLKGRLGTIPWCAPEVLRMEIYSEKCDVFSMGVLLWELETQEPPRSRTGGRIFMTDCLNGFRLPLDRIRDERFKSLIEKCWQEDPHERPSFDWIVEELEAILASHFTQSSHVLGRSASTLSISLRHLGRDNQLRDLEAAHSVPD
eukprot:c6666_g1_i1.p1 GENE.c6666_g1_i1~~c6666_g1_i1.p1  ORF type:complete len:632 (-),score=123.70 c6666_g1_i1:78-1886(-)